MTISPPTRSPWLKFLSYLPEMGGWSKRKRFSVEVQELPFPSDSAVKLALLRAGAGLKMPDCCVLLAAQTAGARVASFDDRLTRAAAAQNLPTV